MAKSDGVLPRTPSVRPKSEIYNPKRGDEHPYPFHMRSPPPPGFDSPISGEISWELILANYLLTSYNDYPFCIKLTADCVHVL